MGFDPNKNQFVLLDRDRELLGVDSQTVSAGQTDELVAAAEAVITREELRDITEVNYKARTSEAYRSQQAIFAARRVLGLVSLWGEFPEPDYDSLLED